MDTPGMGSLSGEYEQKGPPAEPTRPGATFAFRVRECARHFFTRHRVKKSLDTELLDHILDA